tara:strand:+ start:2337 stop:2585 length:249 start_codon:yes stop_codon:yes gene_type:complete
MAKITKKRMDFEILVARQVAQTISLNYKDFDVKDIMACYVMAIGASMSIVYEDATASKVKEACGEWAKRGFLEANSVDLPKG